MATSDKGKGGGVPGFPFDLNNLFNLQFDQLRLALEYLARQQGEQQKLINELLGRAPGAMVTDYPIRTQNPSQIDIGDLDGEGQGVNLSMDAGIPGTGKDFEDDALRDGMKSPL